MTKFGVTAFPLHWRWIAAGLFMLMVLFFCFIHTPKD